MSQALIDWSLGSFWCCVGSVAFAPTFWNIVARSEHRSRWLTKRMGGDPYRACYLLAAVIFVLSLEREWAFGWAISEQPQLDISNLKIGDIEVALLAKVVSLIMWAIGSTLVLSSFYRLGITGTYLGDYFGILMDDIVRGFPFNLLANPMYMGTVLNFLAGAIWIASPAGVLLSAWVYLVYMAAIAYEEPFTYEIYAERERRRQLALKKRN